MKGPGEVLKVMNFGCSSSKGKNRHWQTRSAISPRVQGRFRPVPPTPLHPHGADLGDREVTRLRCPWLALLVRHKTTIINRSTVSVKASKIFLSLLILFFNSYYGYPYVCES